MLIIVSALLLSANAYSQSITLNSKNVSLESVLESVSKQAGYKVFYKQEQLAKANPVSVSFKKLSLNAALDQVFVNQPFTYAIANKTIVITEKQSPKKSSSAVIKRAISGIVTDDSKDPLPGATVREVGTNNVTITNAEGAFTLTVDEKAQIQISFVGFEARTITVGDQTAYNISLKAAASKLNEVVVSTGIFNKVDQSYTGASTTVTAKELELFGNRNLITSLRNVDPSFNIIESNLFGSDPNRLPELQIRGNSSLPNVNDLQNETRVALNTPLIILDGFETTLQKLLDMNSNEVESLTILKDAAATAIYGSRGANGVVVITSKAPKQGKLRVSYSANINVEAPDLSAYNLLNAKDKLALEETMGLYNNNSVATDLRIKRYYNYILNDINSGVDTYWLDIPLNTGVGQRHNLRLEGGDQKFRYSASVQLNDIQGVMKGSDRNTYNGTINLAYTHNKIRFSNNLMISDGNSANSPYGSFSDYVKLNPYWKAYDENGKALKFLGDYGNLDWQGRWGGTLPTNPLYNATLNVFDKTNTFDITNNTSIEFPIFKELIMRGSVGFTKGENESDRFRPADHTAFAAYTEADIFRKGDYNYGITNRLSYNAALNLSYNKTFGGKHTVFAGMDYSIRENQYSSYNFLTEGFNSSDFDIISMAQKYATGKPSGSEGLLRSVGFTGNANYSYDNRYFVDASYRIDGSSQFGANKRFAPFWAFGAGWNLHNESFLKDSKVINRLKLRGSLGITGSQNFSTYQALSSYRYFTDDRYFNWNGTYLLGLGNPDLKWQQTMKYDVGMDAEFLNTRLKLSADTYIQTTNGMISSVTLPASSGFNSYTENMGKVENRGYELRVTGVLIKNTVNKFQWSVSMGMNHNENKIVEISKALKDAQKKIEEQTLKDAQKNSSLLAAPSTTFKEGYSTSTIWVVPSLGIDPSTGNELYMGKDGLPTYTWKAADLVAVGSTDPTIWGNFSTRVMYKNLSLNMSFGYRLGAELYNQTLINKVENADIQYNVDSRVYYDRWKTLDDRAAFKGITPLTSGSATPKSSRFVQDERTLKCQSITAQYNLRSKFLSQSIGVNEMNFTASMSDPFYMSSIKQERGTSYPFSRQLSFSITTTF